MSKAAATAFSLITSWAVSRPTPARTDAIRIFVVARNGRYLSSSRCTTASKTPNSSSTVSIVSSIPSNAKNASGSITLRTTEQKTSPSFHCPPARSAAIVW